jgi:hypothetical protein
MVQFIPLGRHRRLIMGKEHNDQIPTFIEARNLPDQGRRLNEQRKLKSKGYTYISMVGWMDRCENNRRTKDSFEF